LRDLEALEHVWLGRQIDRREFVESLVEKLEQTMLPGEQNFPGVMVLDAMAARGLFFKHVTILGVNEKVFPRFVSEEPFLNDHNRALIAMTLDAKLDTKREAVQHEKWLFYLALSSGEQVTLSYQRANDEGRVLAPSVFLREVAYRLPEAQGKTFDEYVLEHVPQCNRMQLGQSEPLETLTPGELLMRVDDESVFEKFAGDRDIFRRALEAVRASETADRLGPRDGILGAAFKSHWAKYSGRISPTFLERYAICPMACLLGRVIGLQPFERPEEIEQVAPLDLGNIAHQTLAAFYEAYDGRDPMALLDRVWNRVTAKFDEQRFVRYPLLWSIDKRRLYHALRRFLSEYDLPAWEKNPIVRKRCEVEPPGSVAIPGIDGVKFKGTLDRLFELSDGTVRVDDYKWKVKGQGGAVNAALQGRAIQLAIYTRLAGAMVPEAQRIHANLILLRRLLHPETLKEALGEEPVKIFDALPEDFWKENGDRFAANMSSLVDLLSRGIFFVNPSDACSSCDYSTTCRKSHYPTAQRPVDDPAVAPYWEVRNSK
jgi:RecB family exonuclease